MNEAFMGLERHGGKWLMTKFSFWGGVTLSPQKGFHICIFETFKYKIITQHLSDVLPHVAIMSVLTVWTLFDP